MGGSVDRIRMNVYYENRNRQVPARCGGDLRFQTATIRVKK